MEVASALTSGSEITRLQRGTTDIYKILRVAQSTKGIAYRMLPFLCVSCGPFNTFHNVGVQKQSLVCIDPACGAKGVCNVLNPVSKRI